MQPSGLKVLMTPMMAFMVPRRNKVFVQHLKRRRWPHRPGMSRTVTGIQDEPRGSRRILNSPREDLCL